MRRKSICTKAMKPLVLSILLTLPFAASAQRTACKKWTYDHSETVRYSDTALGACKSYVKEKYPNDNYAAAVEATNDPKMFRCSAGDTYIGIVYLRECESCCKTPSHSMVRYAAKPDRTALAGQMI